MVRHLVGPFTVYSRQNGSPTTHASIPIPSYEQAYEAALKMIDSPRYDYVAVVDPDGRVLWTRSRALRRRYGGRERRRGHLTESQVITLKHRLQEEVRDREREGRPVKNPRAYVYGTVGRIEREQGMARQRGSPASAAGYSARQRALQQRLGLGSPEERQQRAREGMSPEIAALYPGIQERRSRHEQEGHWRATRRRSQDPGPWGKVAALGLVALGGVLVIRAVASQAPAPSPIPAQGLVNPFSGQTS